MYFHRRFTRDHAGTFVAIDPVFAQKKERGITAAPLWLLILR
jgi:hypothetical protein